MGKQQHLSRRNDNILNASELSQYMFCSWSWYLQRCGYRPQSPLLDYGKRLHTNHGEIIKSIDNENRRARTYLLIGILLILIALLFILTEVIV